MSLSKSDTKNGFTTLPKVSILIICWNNKAHLKKCFDSIRKQTYKNIETILIDNDSTDESVPFTRRRYPEVRILPLNKNYGFAEGNNRGLRLVLAERQSKYVFILNPDTKLRQNTVEKLVLAAENHPAIGSFTPKILMMEVPNRIQSAGGDCITRGGDNIASSFFYSTTVAGTNETKLVFGSSGAASFFRTDMLREVGLYDSKLFTYYEDVDLNFKIQFSNWRCLYVPSSVLYHYQGGTLDDFSKYKSYLLNSNKYIVLMQNLPINILWNLKIDIFMSFIHLCIHFIRTKQISLVLSIIYRVIICIPHIAKIRLSNFIKYNNNYDSSLLMDLINEHTAYTTSKKFLSSMKEYQDYMRARYKK